MLFCFFKVSGAKAYISCNTVPSGKSWTPLKKKKLFIYLFLNFRLRWVSDAVLGLSPAVVSGGCSVPWSLGFSSRWFLSYRL